MAGPDRPPHSLHNIHIDDDEIMGQLNERFMAQRLREQQEINIRNVACRLRTIGDAIDQNHGHLFEEMGPGLPNIYLVSRTAFILMAAVGLTVMALTIHK